MSVKVMALIARKQGMTPEAFRTAYEERHSRIGVRLFGHLWLEYRRQYLVAANSFADESGTATGAAAGGSACPYDVVTEFLFPDMAALEESNRIAEIPENKRLLSEDEARLFDRGRSWVSVVEIVEEELGRGDRA